MTLREFLKQVVHGDRLSSAEAAHCCSLLLDGSAEPAQVAGLLCALHARGESVQELSGFLTTMRARMTPVASPASNAIDLCGTGGDGSHSFNLSTASALLASACGATVAKHGNRAVSSRSGSADLIEALSFPIPTSASEAEQQLRIKRFAFLFAPHFHPAMKSVAPVRKELGVRTIFNLLGPLANPASVKRQLIGVYHPRWLRPVVETLADTGSEFVITVHGDGGLDEITPHGATRYCMLRDGKITEGIWYAADWGASPAPHEAVAGGDATENAARLIALAQGGERELALWLLANSAPALVLAGIANDFREGIVLARACLTSGDFADYLETLRTA